MSPITVTTPDDGTAPTLTITPKPDETDGERGVWTMDKSVAEAFPTLTEALTAAGFIYDGEEEKPGKGKDADPVVTLRYSRPDPDALSARSEAPVDEPEDDVAEPEPDDGPEPEDDSEPAPKTTGKKGKS